MEQKLLTAQEVQDLLRISRASLFRFVRDGKVIAPIKLGTRSFWRAADIEEFINNLPTSEVKDENEII